MSQPAHHHTPADTSGDPTRAEQGRDVLAELAALAVEDHPEWQDRALCAQTDPEAFFPEKGGSTREAREICNRCEVRSECLEAALGQDQRFGVWGGLGEQERRRLKRSTAAHRATGDPTTRHPRSATLSPAPGPDEMAQPRESRESAPAPGAGRHVGGTGLATTLPTEPRHPRGRAVQARRSTFPARARATQPANSEVTPTAASRTRRSRPSPPPALAHAEQPSTDSDASRDTATVTALAPAAPRPHRAGEHAEPAEDQAAAPPAPAQPPDNSALSCAATGPAGEGVLERVLAAHAGQPGADTVRAAVIAALAAGEPVTAASLWETALAAVVGVESGRTRAAVARLLGEDSRDIAHWVRRHWEGMPMVDPRRDGTPEGTTPEPREPLGGVR